MTTQSWSTRIRHDSDAMFREWGSEMNTKLAAVGMVQTSDTGQINWTTVTRAGTNSVAGYEIWRFADSMQATAPIYIRIDYATGSVAAGPRMNITVGTGTNGSGTITGTALSTARAVNPGSATANADTVRQSYMVHTEGLFAFAWKTGSGQNTMGVFILCRTCDGSGTPTATGALVCWGPVNGASSGGGGGRQALRFAATAVAYTAQTGMPEAAITFNPLAQGTTAVGADLQAMLCYTLTPRVEPINGICAVLTGEVGAGTTFTATIIGSTPHTYIVFPTVTNGIYPDPGHTMSFGVIWE